MSLGQPAKLKWGVRIQRRSRFSANLRILMVVVWLCKRMSFVLYAEIDPKGLRDEGEIYSQMVEEREKNFFVPFLTFL